MTEKFVQLIVQRSSTNPQYSFNTMILSQAPPAPVDYTVIVGADTRWNVYVDLSGLRSDEREAARRAAVEEGAKLVLGLKD